MNILHKTLARWRQSLFKKLGGRELYIRFETYKDETNKLLDEHRNECEDDFKILKNTLKIAQKEKIRVIFVWENPALWKNVATLFHELSQDTDFELYIIHIPSLMEKKHKDGSSHPFFMNFNAEVFFKNFPCTVINGYDCKQEKCFDLKYLRSDYVFFSTPYTGYRIKQYHTQIVSRYAIVCHIHYGLSMLKKSVLNLYATDYFQQNSLVFAETRFHQKMFTEEALLQHQDFNTKQVHYAGWGAGEYILHNKPSENEQNRKWKKEGFKILWTPRHHEGEGNCFFKEYKDLLFEYCENKKYPFVFRPHPLAFRQYVETGILTEEEFQHMLSLYHDSTYCTLDLESSSLPIIHSADVLVSDPSGFMMEFLLTGKPIIYCHRTTDWANEFYIEVLEQAAYWVHNFDELQNTLDMLASGNDPLKNTRKEVIAKYLITQDSGKNIKDIIKADFLSHGNPTVTYRSYRDTLP